MYIMFFNKNVIAIEIFRRTLVLKSSGILLGTTSFGIEGGWEGEVNGGGGLWTQEFWQYVVVAWWGLCEWLDKLMWREREITGGGGGYLVFIIKFGINFC